MNLGKTVIYPALEGVSIYTFGSMHTVGPQWLLWESWI